MFLADLPLSELDRQALFEKIKTGTEWQQLKSDRRGRFGAFEKDIKIKRLEAFFGCIIGAKNPPPRITEDGKTATYTPDPQDLKQEATGYTINDLFGESSRRSWDVLEDNGSDSTLLKFIKTLFTSSDLLAATDRPDGKALGYLLQCNVNLYRPNADMSFHRDDTTLPDGNMYRPQTFTFLPAAVTVVLTPDGNMNRSFCLKRCKTCESVKSGMNDSNCIREGHNVTSRDYFNQAYAICLNGLSYKFGVHGIGEGQRDSGGAFERMSLNFRVVRNETFKLFMRDEWAKINLDR
jgi:hypothetical protein